MADFSTNLASPANCFAAQILGDENPTNTDVVGVGVGVSNIVTNILLPILLRWSDKDKDSLDPSVYMQFSQVFPILIATVASIGKGTLSLFDAHFAIAVTASPISIFMVYSAFRDLIKQPTILFPLIKDKKIIRFLSLIQALFWIALNPTLSFSPVAFLGSSKCKNMNPGAWLAFQFATYYGGTLDVMGRRDLWNDIEHRGGLGTLSLILVWIWGAYLVRHRVEIYVKFQIRKAEQLAKRSIYWRWLFAIWQAPMTSWDVVTAHHPWIILLILACVHWSWVLGMVRGMQKQRPQMPYGQILALFSTLPPIIATYNLCSNRLKDLKKSLRDLPHDFWKGIRFFFSGNSSLTAHPPYEPPAEAKIPSMSWILVLPLAVFLNVTEAVWMYYYVRAGSVPNPHFAVNTNHPAWRAYSIMLSIFALVVNCFNMFLWVKYQDSVSRGPSHTSLPEQTLPEQTPKRLDRFKLTVFRLLRITIAVLIAAFMCTAPMFSPRASLPLAEQYEWNHRCDTFSFEVVLDGRPYTLQQPPQPPPSASFYSIQSDTKARTKEFEYVALFSPATPNLWSFTLSDFSSSSSQPQIFYDSEAYTISGLYGNGTSQILQSDSGPLSMSGNFTDIDRLTFSIRDLLTGEVMKLRAVDAGWSYDDDAPNFILREVLLDGEIGDVVVQTAVTKRNVCSLLKLCLAGNPNAVSLAPIGLALWSQYRYSYFCTKPK